ncbi:hypothetical protein ACFFP0_24840 [Rhizobium puerariae]|uniref:Uncharacterized protein n=1 Tax=Rhizobium puerariae TaxID=1585791 RepID=A0ABV6APR0_9HYPH
MTRKARAFILRLYDKRSPLGTADDDLHAYLVAAGYCYSTPDGRLLMLTRDGKDYAREQRRAAA